MAKVSIIATIIVKTGHIERVKAQLLKLIDVSRDEAGCLTYDLHQDNDNPAHFVFYENWESHELWQKHVGNRHVQSFIALTEDALEAFTLNAMTPM